MSHHPEEAQLYICTECNVVYAGTIVEHGAGNHRYDAPATCAVCGNDEFIEDEDWPHHHD